MLKRRLIDPRFDQHICRWFVLICLCAHLTERPQSGIDVSRGHENFTAVVGNQFKQFKR